MSKFRTIVPIDLKQVTDALPKRSFVHTIDLLPDKSGVEVTWDCDDLKTAYTFPIEYPFEKLLKDAKGGFSVNVTDKESVDKPAKRSKKTPDAA